MDPSGSSPRSCKRGMPTYPTPWTSWHARRRFPTRTWRSFMCHFSGGSERNEREGFLFSSSKTNAWNVHFHPLLSTVDKDGLMDQIDIEDCRPSHRGRETCNAGSDSCIRVPPFILSPTHTCLRTIVPTVNVGIARVDIVGRGEPFESLSTRQEQVRREDSKSRFLSLRSWSSSSSEACVVEVEASSSSHLFSSRFPSS